MDDITAPEDISEVDREILPSSTAPQQQKVDVPSGHDDDKAREIEAAFNTQERTNKLKQKAHDEGKELAQQSKEVLQPPPPIPIQEVSKPDQEIPEPPTPDDQKSEHLQTQSDQTPSQTGSKLAIAGTVFQQERKKLRAENREVEKAA